MTKKQRQSSKYSYLFQLSNNPTNNSTWKEKEKEDYQKNKIKKSKKKKKRKKKKRFYVPQKSDDVDLFQSHRMLKNLVTSLDF